MDYLLSLLLFSNKNLSIPGLLFVDPIGQERDMTVDDTQPF